MSTHPLAADAMTRPAADSAVLRRAFAFVFQSPVALGILTGGFAIAGLVLVFGRFALHDEGLLTYVFARWLTLDPAPVFFFQKVKPVVCAVWALPSLGGADALLVLHVLVAALVGPMLAAVARSLGIRLPNLPALIVLVSSLFLFGAASGVSNVDGVVGTTLFLYLSIAKRRDWLAGVVLGCLPWVRSELAPFSFLLWLYMTFAEHRRGVTLGAMLFPVLYVTGGSAYHRDALWFLHFPPATRFPMPGNPMWDDLVSARELLVAQLMVTPVIGFALTAQWSRLSPVERVLGLFALVSLLLLGGLPFLRLGNFAGASRYGLQPLPVVALLVARAVEPWMDGDRSSWRLLLVAAVLAAIWPLSAAIPTAVAVPLIGACLAAAVLGSLGWWRSAATVIAAAAGLGFALPHNEMATPAAVEPALAWLDDRADEVRGATIFTNSPEIAFAIARRPALGETPVRFVVAPDMTWEVVQLSNPANGQRAALERITRSELFPPSVLWNEISPASIPPRSLFILRDDPRQSLLLPDAVWAGHIEPVARGEGFAVGRLVRRADPGRGA